VLSLVAALALLTADSGSGRPLRDHCDRIELNHVLDSCGNESLCQVIFWGFSPAHDTYIVRAWRSHKSFAQSPWKAGPNLYRVCWHDSRDGNAMRDVTAGSFIETWTDYDAESTNQEIVGRNERRELTPPVKRKGAK